MLVGHLHHKLELARDFQLLKGLLYIHKYGLKDVVVSAEQQKMAYIAS